MAAGAQSHQPAVRGMHGSISEFAHDVYLGHETALDSKFPEAWGRISPDLPAESLLHACLSGRT